MSMKGTPTKMSSRRTDKEQVYAYGFDRIGFQVADPTAPVETNTAIIEWVSYEDERALDRASGVIIVQGVFERFREVRGALDDFTKVECDRDLMLERERQVRNIVARGGWVCFLVGKIIDHVRQGYNIVSVEETDLCKRTLSSMDVTRENVDAGLTHVRSSTNEFIKYIQKYGVAKTVFGHVQWHDEMTILASASHYVVGFSVSASVFFLPFHTTARDASTAKDAVSIVADAAIGYRRKSLVEVPKWANSFRFQKEQELLAKLERLRAEFTEAEAALNVWDSYKRILVMSGEFLCAEVVKIFSHYFSLHVNAVDEGREDFKLVHDETVLALAEVKGTNGGVKREFINQVDSHRERNGLTPEVPGLLIINNEMQINSIAGRLKTAVPDDQIKHAKRLNILIVRSIDLLGFMRHVEQEADRAGIVLSLLARGGGWLSADRNGYRIVE